MFIKVKSNIDFRIHIRKEHILDSKYSVIICWREKLEPTAPN